ncbi:MAG: hypothetical protein ACR2OV_13200 [Hyphomicrobiaceae bacterium]
MSDHHTGQPMCAKGPIPYCLDEMSHKPDARALLTKLRDEIEKLRNDDFRGLEGVFQRHLFEPADFGTERSATATVQLQKTWFDDNSTEAFFRTFQPIAPIYAAGVLKTLELSLGGQPEPLPIDSWWLMGFPSVEMVNFVSGRQVTLLILTPKSEEFAGRKLLGERAQAWSTARGIITHRL